MLYYKQGRFHAGDVSFELPDNTYIDPFPETEGAGLYLRSMENDHYAIMVAAEHVDGEYRGEMRDFVTHISAEPVFEDYVVNNLTGYSATYRSSRNQYFEVRFSVNGAGEDEEGEEQNVLVFAITAESTPSIDAIVHSPLVQQFLSSFRRD